MKPGQLLLALLIAFGLAAWIGVDAARTSAPVAAHPAQAAAVAQIAALTLPDLAGKPQPLAQWQGQVRVINYWATWCRPCRDEMPAFSHLHDMYRDRGVIFIGISIDEPEKIRGFLQEVPVTYPLLVAGPDSLAPTAELGNGPQGLPFTLVLGRDGQALAMRLGRYDEAALQRVIERAL